MTADARRVLGAGAEDLVARHYASAGWDVLARNWRCREGELDLILRRGGVIVFCEVKARSTDRFGGGAAAVTPAKQARIRRLAMRWLAETAARAPKLRFDVAVVEAGAVRVIEGAF